MLRYPEFALWCGTEQTADWHVRYRATAVVYGHLHIPQVAWEDGGRFVEASLGYPREWRGRAERMKVVHDDPYLLLVAGKASSVRDLLPVLEKVMQTGRRWWFRPR